jgi:hypothetical protein
MAERASRRVGRRESMRFGAQQVEFLSLLERYGRKSSAVG